MYYPGQRPTGFDVYNNFYVFLESADLQNFDESTPRWAFCSMN